MKIINVGFVSLYSSSPEDAVKGYIDVQNDYSDLTVDVFWAYGTFDSGAGTFSFRAYTLEESITFPGLMSTRHETFAFYTPNDPGTWDLMGILANDIYLEGDNLVVVGQHGGAIVSEGAWTISSAAELKALNVGIIGG